MNGSDYAHLSGTTGSATLSSLVDPASRTTAWPASFEQIVVQTPRGERSASLNFRYTPGPSGAQTAFHVHGLGGASTNWTDLATALSGQVASIAVDLPGFGISDPAPDGDYSLDAYIRWTIASIEATAAEPVHLVGNSMGGLVSMGVAVRRPDLVRTLTLISPAVPGFDTNTDADPRMVLLAVPLIGTRLAQRFNLADARERAMMSIRLCFADPDQVPEYRIAQAAEEVRVRARYPWAITAPIKVLRQLVAIHLHRRPNHPWKIAGQIDVPTTIIWGDKDRLVPVGRGSRLAAVIPDATLEVFGNVGHTAQLEVPLRTAETMLPMLQTQRVDQLSERHVA